MAVAPGIHIVEDFEKAFQDCLAALTNPDLHNARDTDEVRTSVDLTIQRFLDVSKQMDCFFLQKRLLLSVQKPEHLLVENIQELNNEVNRKDALIEKYNAKIQSWQALVQEASGTTPRPPPPPVPIPNQPLPGMQSLQGSPSQPPVMPPHPHPMMQQHPHGMPGMTSSPAPMQSGMVMHPQQQPGLQGPLAYLERTMSNIGHL